MTGSWRTMARPRRRTADDPAGGGIVTARAGKGRCYFCDVPVDPDDETAIVAGDASAHEACWHGAFGLAPPAGGADAGGG